MKKIIIGILVMLLLCGCKKNDISEEGRAYRAYLSADTIDWHGWGDESSDTLKFYIIDINNDGIQEMFVENDNAAHAAGYVSVFTYSNGELKELSILSLEELYIGKSCIIVSSYFGQGHGNYYFYTFNSKDGFQEIMSYNTVQNIYSTVAQIIDEGFGDSMHKIDNEFYGYGFMIGNENVTYEEFEKHYNELIHGARNVNIDDNQWINNTRRNRNKYIN